jgi:hypothetical protein
MSADEAITKLISTVVSEAGKSTTKLETPIPQRLGTPENSYWERLVHYNSNLGKDELLYPEFAALQRLNVIHLHNTLAEIKADTWQKKTTSKAQMAELKTAMHDYGIKSSTKDTPGIVPDVVKLRQSETQNT